MFETIPSNFWTPFIYAVPINAAGVIAANATAIGNLVLDTASDFVLYGYVSSTSADNGGSAPNNFSVYIKNTTTGFDLTQGLINQAAIAPPASYFLEEKVPIRFAKQTQIQFNFLNLTGGQITVSFYLKGYKIYTDLPGTQLPGISG